MSKTDHLAKAKDYIARGDDYYRQAADEIVLAMEADSSLTQLEVAERIGKSVTWVQTTLRALRLGTAPDWNSGSNRRDEVARKVLRDPVQRREVIESLEPEERAELVREVSRSTTPAEHTGDADWQDVQDAPKHDLSAQAAKFVATASQIEVLLADGAEFRRLDAKGLQRLDRDLGRVRDTAEKLQEQVAVQSRVRRIA